MRCTQGHAGMSTEVAPGRWPSSQLARDRIFCSSGARKPAISTSSNYLARQRSGWFPSGRADLGDDTFMSS